MRYRLHKHFIKACLKLPHKTQDILHERLRLFSVNPVSRELNNHFLSGKYEGYRSINITGDFRAVYKTITKDVVIFVHIGTHAQLYD